MIRAFKTSAAIIIFAVLGLTGLSWISPVAHASESFDTVHYEHEYDRFLRDIPLKGACVTPTEIRSIKPVRSCVKLEPVNQAAIVDRPNLSPTWVCRKFADVKLVYPRDVQTAYCTQSVSGSSTLKIATPDCPDVVYRRDSLPKTIFVREVRTDFRGTKIDYKTVSHTFEDCE